MRPLLALAALALVSPVFGGNEPGERGEERGLAILAAKALTVPFEGPQAVDNAVILVRGGKIEAVGPRKELEIPEGYEVLDIGERWHVPDS